MAARKSRARRSDRGARRAPIAGARGAARRPARLARPADGPAERHLLSPTAVAAAALRSGVLPGGSRRRERIPHEDETIRVGDPDDDSLANEYVGEDLPGGSTPTPDQSNVDEIGRAYGLQDEDNGGSLRTSSEVLARRDRRRSELRPPRRTER